MPKKTIKGRRHVTKKGYKKRINSRKKKQQTKRVKNTRSKRSGKRGGAPTQTRGWSGFLKDTASTYAPGLTQQISTTAKGTALAQQAAQTLGENAETIDQLQTAFLAIQRQVDNQLVKFKTTKEENLLKKFQKECGDKGPACVVEKQAEFFAKEQAEGQRRTVANDAFWATLIEKDPDLPEYTGLSNIELFTVIVDNWGQIQINPALISAIKSYYKCPGPNTPEALLACFKQKANEIFATAVDQFETKLHSYVDQYLTGDASVRAKTGITMAANVLKSSPSYAKAGFQVTKDFYNASPKTREYTQKLAERSKAGIESGFTSLKNNVTEPHHKNIDKMKDFLLHLHDVSTKLTSLQEEVSSIEQEAEAEAKEDDFEDTQEGP